MREGPVCALLCCWVSAHDTGVQCAAWLLLFPRLLSEKPHTPTAEIPAVQRSGLLSRSPSRRFPPSPDPTSFLPDPTSFPSPNATTVWNQRHLMHRQADGLKKQQLTGEPGGLSQVKG